MQDYDFYHSESTSSESASTLIQPSPQVVQNILQYARCFQNIKVGEKNIKVYLN